jgi:hypothetical protein
MPGINDLDTSLPLQHYNGPSAYDNALKGQQISSMLTEQNLQKQTLATQQSQMARQGQMRGVMAQNAGNPDQTATAMTQAGLGPEAQQYQQTQAENTYKLAQAKWNDAHAQFMMNNVSPGMQKTVDQQHINGANAARMFLQEFPDPTKAYTDPVTAQNMKTAYERDYYPMMKGITNMGEILPPQYSDGAYTKMQIAAKMYPDIKDEEAGAKATTAGAAVTSAGAKAGLVPVAQQNADTNSKNAETNSQNADTKAQEAQDKAAYQQGLLKNQQILNAVKDQKIKAALNSTGGAALSKLEIQEQQESKMALSGRGPEGLNDKKVAGAIDSRAALNRYYDPQTGMYNVPKTGYAEISSSLAPLLSVAGGGQGSETQREELQAKTLKGMINNFASWASGDPLNATTQANLKQLANQIDAIGLQSEQNRDKYGLNRADKWSKLGVAADRAKLLATSEGTSYKDYLQQQHLQLGFEMDDRTAQQLYGQSGQPKAAAQPHIVNTPKGGSVDLSKFMR